MADRDPWIKFRPDYWLNDLALQSCSLESQGLLINLMCLMHGTTPYGYLLVGGVQPTDKVMGKVLGVHPTRYRRCLGELLANHVLRIDDDGRIYSNRMRLDWEKRQVAQEAGKLGGNPKLVNPQSAQGVKTEENKKQNKNKNKKWNENHARLASLLAEQILENHPGTLEAKKPEKWADTIRLMETSDGRDLAEVRKIIDWTAKSEFWNGVILSATGLRRNYDKALAQMEREENTPEPKRGCGNCKRGPTSKIEGRYCGRISETVWAITEPCGEYEER